MSTQNLTDMAKAARAAADTVRTAPADTRNAALLGMAAEVLAQSPNILAANRVDMDAAKVKGLSAAMLDRLELTTDRIIAIADNLEAIAALPDPVGAEDERWTRPNGLTIAKVRVPIGVIGIIYESRPNVTADAGALCLKSGNACILRGGSESARSNAAIHAALVTGLQHTGLPEAVISRVETTDRAAVGELLAGFDGRVDLIIPRGGKSLVARVQKDARVPVLAHLDGLNHSYVHADADPDMAVELIANSKMRRTGVCGATETLLIDSDIAASLLPRIAERLQSLGCEMRVNDAARAILPHATPATDTDFETEHLDAILNIKIVSGTDEALAHIDIYGSGHTDAIITENDAVAQNFLARVDSAICVRNASTQFADGGEFGFGAEIGIATGRLHARGPVGAQHLTTYKYHVLGTGQIRP